ncbi:MAG TPA: hypothetical protein VII22_11490 [Streptosporangiaceae bacterium]
MTVQIFGPLAHLGIDPGERRGPGAATLQLVREGFGFELRRGTFHVLLDGNDVASIEWKQTIDVPIKPGHHSLQIRAGRYSSRIRSFDTADGEIVNFRCTAPGSGPSTSRPSSSPTWHSGSSASEPTQGDHDFADTGDGPRGRQTFDEWLRLHFVYHLEQEAD